jgi:hypothetical protein
MGLDVPLRDPCEQIGVVKRNLASGQVVPIITFAHPLGPATSSYLK